MPNRRVTQSVTCPADGSDLMHLASVYTTACPTLMLQLAQCLPDLDLVSSASHKCKVLRRFKDHDNRATQHEPSHLLARRQGLTMQQCGCLRVNCFGKCVRGMFRMSFVCSKVLREGKYFSDGTMPLID